MIMDKTTEAIAYFIGLFQTATEEVSSRIDYSSFHFFRKHQSLDPLLERTLIRDAQYGPDGYDPQVQALLPPPTLSGNPVPAVTPFRPDTAPHPQPALPGSFLPADIALARAIGTAKSSPPVVEAPAPNSTITITWQQNILTDQDILDMSAETAQSFVQAQSQALAALQEQAARLQVLQPISFEPGTDQDSIGAAEAAETTFEAIVTGSDRVVEDLPDASVHLLTGEAVEGVTVNGQQSQDMPPWQDFMPRSMQPEDTGQIGEKTNDEDSDPAHIRITGNNITLNEAVVTSGFDATVIAVGGDVVSLDAISQVNALRDDAQDPGDENEMLNAAGFSGLPTEEAPSDAGSGGIMPGLISLATIEGDLISYDWIRQVNKLGDEDAVSFTTSGSESFLSVGENRLMNTDSVMAPGLSYDLIIVKGDFISWNIVSQTNILQDQDKVLTSPPDEDAPLAPLGEPGSSRQDQSQNQPKTQAESATQNLTTQPVQSGPADSATAGTATVGTAKTGSATVGIDGTTETEETTPSTDGAAEAPKEASTSTPADDEPALPDPPETPEAPAPPAPLEVSEPTEAMTSSGSSLINIASITHGGSDVISGLTGAFKSVLEGFDPDEPDLTSVLTSRLFEATKVFDVLYVTGDLINVREVAQINILSDSDLIHKDTTDDGATTTAGENAAVNLATLIDTGLPSHIMAGGSVFSDAVLYQAKLISDDAAPSGVKYAPGSDATLASEAVAFLADDLGTKGDLMDFGSDTTTATTDVPGHLDVMTTMLT